MCGIVGVFGKSARPALLGSMTAAVAHRGPDDAGAWFDPAAEIALGHRRLSLVDVSQAGRQPMVSDSGQYVLTYNGEIYNFLELRRELEQQGSAPKGGWRGHSDTEVLLEAIASWGIERALQRSSGMFAFALWDRRNRRLTLVRDRFGEKPLYYGWVGKEFVFGSELKALCANPDFNNPISREAVTLFASRTNIPAPFSIYERIFKLPAGHMLEVTLDGARTPLDRPPQEGASSSGMRLKCYWSYSDMVRRGLEDPIVDECDALEQLEDALAKSVQEQSFADVPVGAFLSGGIDSSLVAALNRRDSSTPLITFAIGFEDPAYNEAHHAEAVARHLSTSHHEEYVTAERAREIIPLLPSIYDEPFADPSQIATHLVSRLAKREVEAVLTGDGGDELFGGYYHHLIAPRVWDWLERLPRPARRIVTSGLGRVPWKFWNMAAGLASRRNQAHIGPKIQRALRAATQASDLNDIHRSLLEEWDFGSSPVIGATPALLPAHSSLPDCAPGAVQMMYADCMSYLPDDILCKVDRAAMAVGLETRAPFLDHRVADVAARIPLSMKVQNGRGKLVLRKLLHRYVPSQIVDRPKSGFAVPVGEWIKSPLRSWAEELLEPGALRDEGWFDPGIVTSKWRAHLRGTSDSTAALWGVLMFQSWVRQHQQSAATFKEPRTNARFDCFESEPLAV